MKEYIQFYGTVLVRQLLKCFHIFPIKNNRILFYSFNAKQYSCNPKYISEALCDQSDDFEIIWAFKEPDQFKSSLDPKIKTVRFRSLKYYYYAKTSKVIVQNVQGFGELSRRKNQTVIQTWHASNGYKRQGNYTGMKRRLQSLYHKDYSYVMSGAKSMTERRVRGTMGFRGPVLSGTPRMDAIIHQNNTNTRENVYTFFKLNTEVRLLLYAPTWRNDRSETDYGMDYGRLYETIQNRFGGKWKILVRYHPNVNKNHKLDEPFLLDATDYPDMQDLICSVDILISDYSSCIWDFSFTYKPCLLYCTDLEQYGKDRAFDIPVKDWHFPISTNMDELIGQIFSFDKKDFKASMQLHHKEMGSLEDGNATKRVCSLISSICGE